MFVEFLELCLARLVQKRADSGPAELGELLCETPEVLAREELQRLGCTGADGALVDKQAQELVSAARRMRSKKPLWSYADMKTVCAELGVYLVQDGKSVYVQGLPADGFLLWLVNYEVQRAVAGARPFDVDTAFGHTTGCRRDRVWVRSFLNAAAWMLFRGERPRRNKMDAGDRIAVWQLYNRQRLAELPAFKAGAIEMAREKFEVDVLARGVQEPAEQEGALAEISFIE